MRSRVAAAVLVILSALPLAAGTIRVVPYAYGRVVSDAEACLWRGRDGDAFFDRFLASGDVHCYPVANIPQPPDGLWNYYVQSATGVSSHPFAIELIGRGPVRPVSVELLPSGTLNLGAATAELRAGEYFALYISNEHRDSSRPAVRPIPRGQTDVLIPADMHVILLLISGEQIVWASRPLLVQRGGTLHAPLPDRATHDVILLVGLDTNVDSEERDMIKGTTPPHVSLVAENRALHPDLELRPAPLFDTSIVQFTGVPPGEYTARLGGEYWLPNEVAVRVPAHPTSIAQPSRRIVTRPRSRADVRWYAARTLAGARSAACAATPAQTTHLVVTHCAFGFARSEPSDCVTVHDEEITTESGQRALEQLVPGDYYVTLRHGETSTRERFSVKPARTATVTITLAPGHISGRITRAGAPLAAIVSFATGATSTDEHGNYDAPVADAPADRPVVITPCDTQREFVDVPQRPLLRDDMYDADVPDNHLTISVIDAITQAPLPNTTVTSRIMSPQHTISSRVLGRTNTDGVITDAVLSRNVTFELCARHDAYESMCVRNVRMSHAEEAATISLQPASGRAVRILAEPPTGPGRVYVVIGNSVAAETLIEPDQTIRLTPVAAGAVLYVVAVNYPLLRVGFPDLSAVEPVLRLPRTQAVTRAVTLAADSSHHGGPVALEIDGTPLPNEILQHAQALHNTSEPYINRGETITIGPLDESLQAAILLWHFSADLPADLHVTDPFTNPRTRGLLYRAALDSAHVMLTPDR